jgi:deoxyhypusine synthase
MESNQNVLDKLSENVYKESVTELKDGVPVRGYDFNEGLDYGKVFASYINTGFQATSVG